MRESLSVERLKKLKDLLQIERDEDYLQYKEQFLKASIEQRRKNGVTWYPIKITSNEIGYAELVHLEVERTTHIDTAHQFNSGKNVTLFSNQQNNEVFEINGTIKIAQRNKLKIILHCDDLPDWCYDGKLGVNIQFDDNSYNEMQRALDDVIKAKDNSRVAELREILEGNIPLKFEKENQDIVVPKLNLSQNRAIRKSISSLDLSVIHGPPGTGKTTTLVNAIRVCLQAERQVLVCAPTNTAVDILTEKLLELGITLLRLGHPARISEELVSSSVDGQIQKHQNFSEIKSLRKNAAEYFRMAGKFKRVFGKQDAQQRAAYYTEAKTCLKDARLLEDYIVGDLFNTVQVICCTPVTSTHKALTKKKFNTLFFDEASQALEPMVWIPLLKCNRIILSGDHFQLPPVVKSLEAARQGLGITMLDRCIKFENAVTLLNKQYRMNSPIMAFSNNYFYNNGLEADDTVKDSVLANEEEDNFFNKPIEFVDTAGCSFDEEQNLETLSSFNVGEGNLLFKHLQELLNWHSNLDYTQPIDIGIISPYKEQVSWLKENRPNYELNTEKVSELRIRTIDGFQGEECDIIYISLVRSNSDQQIGFLNDLRRMNVAITRAKKKLIIIGDSATIGSNPFYKSFIEYCEKNGYYRSAWEFA